MKLLGWMHRKLKRNFNECAAKNNTTTYDGFDDDDEKYQKESEVFHGFLSIGTLGDSEAFNTDPPTPTFPTSFEEDNETITDDQDLKFIISKELEKFQFLEAEEEVNIDDATCQASKRSSYASIISLNPGNGKQLLDVDDNHKTQLHSLLLDCPLHKFFYGSSVIDLSSHAHNMGPVNKEEDKKGNKPQLFPKNFMKKMFKNLNSKSNTHAPSSNGTSTKSPSIKNKLPKVLKMLKKKVHPERFIDVKGEKRVINPDDHSRADRVSQMMSPEDNDPFAFTENNTEHWIKTDADYLVLEL